MILPCKKLSSSIWPLNGALTSTIRVDRGVMVMKEYSTFSKVRYTFMSYIGH